ncbi:MAG: phenylacetate--CoA ligase family protein [Gammaproteobacteria bacterium]
MNGLRAFFETPLDTVLTRHLAIDAQAQALTLFRDVAAQVPAYRRFLAAQGVDPSRVRSAADFHSLPLTAKQNYLADQPLTDLCRDGALETCDMLAVSSGSTGTPTFWPRFLTDELAIATRFEQVFHDSFEADRKRTLALVCFALGTWVGGMYTASCCRWLAAKGYPITVVTPGNNKDEILRVTERLAPAFDQLVLLGYPPFLKDLIDTGRARGFDWARYRCKLVMAGEVFSEEWRSLVLARLGANDSYRDSASLYGTADAGVLGNETPLSIAIRRFLAARPEAARALFGASRLPSLLQYDPLSRYFEVSDGTLLFTGDNGVPLIRYHISDEGGIIGYERMLRCLADWGYDPFADLGPVGGRGPRQLPFVYVFGRSHFVISYFGANIYPENVTVALERPEVCEWVTGKFVMQSLEDTDRDLYLQIVVELAPRERPSEPRREALAQAVRTELMRLNSEFAHYVPAERQTPYIELRAAGDPEWFPPGVKHRYTRA